MKKDNILLDAHKQQQKVKSETLLNAGIYLIAHADDSLNTSMLDRAIEELQGIKFTRENIPF